MQTFTKDIVIDIKVRDLCFKPYANHPKGCPNFGKRATCPPQCKLLADVFDLDKGFWIVWIEFNFESHVNRMCKNHPDWTQRQLECCLYWQGQANKNLRVEIQDVGYYLQGRGVWKVTTCPEAMGVNVTETMKKIGIELEWPPKKIVRKVAMFGQLKLTGDHECAS